MTCHCILYTCRVVDAGLGVVDVSLTVLVYTCNTSDTDTGPQTEMDISKAVNASVSDSGLTLEEPMVNVTGKLHSTSNI